MGIVVNSAADTINANDNTCTLREAIIAANNDTASGSDSGECAAGSGAYEHIPFPPTPTATATATPSPTATATPGPTELFNLYLPMVVQ